MASMKVNFYNSNLALAQWSNYWKWVRLDSYCGMSDFLGITQQKNNDSLIDSKHSGLVFTIAGKFYIIFFYC